MGEDQNALFGGFLKWVIPKIMGFKTKMVPFGMVFSGVRANDLGKLHG